MKATFKSNWKIELDNEAIKAIRFVRGDGIPVNGLQGRRTK